MASEKLPSKGQAWFCTTGLPSDIIIEVEDMAFHLHKFPLMSRSMKLHRMIKEQELSTRRAREEDDNEQEEEEEEVCVLSLPEFPGGSETFELAAKFSYGVKLELTPSNAAPLRCAADYLEMTEPQDASDGRGNLVEKTDAFLHDAIFGSVKGAVKTLKSCEGLLPSAENLGIVQLCVDAIALKADSDASLFGWPMAADGVSGELASVSGSVVCRRRVRWYDELNVLGLPFYKRVISAMKARDSSCADTIEGSLICYAKKFIPGLSRRTRGPSSSNALSVSCSSTEEEQRELLEMVVDHMPARRSGNPTTTTRLLFALLRTANILSSSDFCRAKLERKIAAQLDRATLDDLLLPSYSYLIETLYDVDCVERILRYFLQGSSEEGEDRQDEEEISNSPGMNPVMVVAKLIDGYLAEIASDGNLKPEKFYNLAVALPEHSRIYDDGIYRATDVYLKAHPWISDEDRERICSVLDAQKLTLEACTHAAQNERLPLRVVVQVLFFEQLQLRNAITGSFVGTEPSVPDSARASRLQDHIGFLAQSPAGQPCQQSEYSQVLRLDMDSMRARVQELELECSTMRHAIRKFDRTGKTAKGGGSGGGETSDGGGWSSFTKKFGCKFKTQVCDSHERTWVEPKRGNHCRNS